MIARVWIVAMVLVAGCGGGGGTATTQQPSSASSTPGTAPQDEDGGADGDSDAPGSRTTTDVDGSVTSSAAEPQPPSIDATGEDFERIYRELVAHRVFVSEHARLDLVEVSLAGDLAESYSDALLDRAWAGEVIDTSERTYTIDEVEVIERMSDDRVVLLVHNTLEGDTVWRDLDGNELRRSGRQSPARQNLAVLVRDRGSWRIASDRAAASIARFEVEPLPPDGLEPLDSGEVDGIAWSTSWYQRADGSVCVGHEFGDLERVAMCLRTEFVEQLEGDNPDGIVAILRWIPDTEYYVTSIWLDNASIYSNLPVVVGADPNTYDVAEAIPGGAKVAATLGNQRNRQATSNREGGFQYALSLPNRSEPACDVWEIGVGGPSFVGSGGFGGNRDRTSVVPTALASFDEHYRHGESATGGEIALDELPEGVQLSELVLDGDERRMFVVLEKKEIDRQVARERWVLVFGPGGSGFEDQLYLNGRHRFRECR